MGAHRIHTQHTQDTHIIQTHICHIYAILRVPLLLAVYAAIKADRQEEENITCVRAVSQCSRTHRSTNIPTYYKTFRRAVRFVPDFGDRWVSCLVLYEVCVPWYTYTYLIDDTLVYVLYHTRFGVPLVGVFWLPTAYMHTYTHTHPYV